MSTAWDGTISQAELMLKDECILVDEKDAIVGHDSKYNSHRFVASQPHGLLHRAFSVFLFDGAGRLLLQQRAASKVTFPRVWTNTCCSHQLYGYSPSEVDSDKDIATGRVPGAKAAAVRKLHQELGIARGRVSAQDFTFLTRLHYCALDSGTWGPAAEWGEHEVDYILLAQADVDLAPNPDEVMATQYVTREELREMMLPGSGLLWSPWFRLIAEHLLVEWWEDLGAALAGAHADYSRIHEIMPPAP